MRVKDFIAVPRSEAGEDYYDGVSICWPDGRHVFAVGHMLFINCTTARRDGRADGE